MWETKHPNKARYIFSLHNSATTTYTDCRYCMHGNSTTASFCYIHSYILLVATPPRNLLSPPHHHQTGHRHLQRPTPRAPTTTKNNQSSRLSHTRTDALLPPRIFLESQSPPFAFGGKQREGEERDPAQSTAGSLKRRTKRRFFSMSPVKVFLILLFHVFKSMSFFTLLIWMYF